MHHQHARPAALHPLALAVLLALGGALAHAPARAQSAADAQTAAYDLPAGPLDATLTGIARRAGRIIVIDPALVSGRTAGSVRGSLTLEQAFAQALAGSGLEIAPGGDGSYTLRKAPSVPPAPPKPEATVPLKEAVLPVVTVRAGAGGGISSVEPGRVTGKTIARYAATDLEDVLASQPEVSVGGGHAAAQKIYVRGMEDTLFNVRVDGASQVGQVFHHTARVQIEPELLSRVDVQSGTGDATAGPGALGGTLRFVTKDPLELLRPGERVGALMKGGYYSNAEGYKAHTSVFGRLSDDWSAMAALTRQDQNDYEDGSGRPVTPTGSRQQLGFLKLVGKVAQDHTLRLSYDHNRDEGDRTQRPQWVPSSFNRAYPLQRDRQTWNLGYRWQPTDTNADVEISLFQTQAELDQNVVGRWGHYLGKIESTGLDLRNTQRFGAHRLTYGLDHREDRVRAGYAANPSEQQEDGQVSGAYIQASMAATDDLEIRLGARHDRYQLTNVNGARQRASGTSPNLSLRYSVTPELALLAGHARALRGPQARDAFKLETVATTATNTRPERARTSEVGFDYGEGAWRVNAKVYQTTVADAIADPVGKPVQFENVGTLKSNGMLLHTAYDWHSFKLGAGFHHNRSTLNSRRLNGYEHNGLGTSQGDTLTMSIDHAVSERLDIGWLGRFVKGIDALDTTVGTVRKPGYSVHDIYANWRPSTVAGLTVSFVVKNLFGKTYLDHGSNEDFQHIAGYEGVVGFREPGREIRVELAMRF
ncbi:TonB-dependent receptor [Thauera phenylacetica B4P]|uniref:TonB-dependent receptor n=1 Tax=Thauera phenylacetica B4P TaxID=1234382 RepID=N6ZXJ5_9RHOO|nr:TonB-dependent receptor [Thauera phenylacetica]ENO99053.1 TonB-dependent receptor [Thauera phenylacetica B4P]